MLDKVKQRRMQIYRYILQRVGAGNAPTVREICSDLHISSTSTVHKDLQMMAADGLIEITGGLNRAIRLPGETGTLVPLVGVITAGEPILAVQNIEQYLSIPFAKAAHGKELFALRIRGDSMKKAAILDGDIVVFEETPAAENGQIVAALLEDEATVKRFYRENGGFRLQPENDDYAPILLDKVQILGRAVSVMRVL